MPIESFSRRDFGKTFAAAGRVIPSAGAAPAAADEWAAVRAAFILNPKFIVMNAANFCPATPEISGPVVTFRPGAADTGKMTAFLYEKIGFAGATRGGDSPGIRISPHIYNSFAQVEKVVAAISDYLKKV
jgi:selenocysteine lyase/cysteine desulfurase